MSRGGEDLDSVMGRQEDEELPSWGSGAIEFFLGDVATLGPGSEGGRVDVAELASLPGVPALIASMTPVDPYKARMLTHASVLTPRAAEGGVPAPSCKLVVTEPVVFVTRVEYANLFHTTTGEAGGRRSPRVCARAGMRREGDPRLTM